MHLFSWRGILCYIIDIQKIYTLQVFMHGLSYHNFDEKCIMQNTSDALMVVGRQIHKLMIKITILYTGGELNRAY
jgi:hypothetical protein